ncbi:glycine zipper domain-containing protein [Nitratidesulfovibrio liaohensis]|uniref:Glycine zipper domain-containing protein n=1 Tax=Nitratidesulfovibrio liaohensis TaxID=2604158 RepID=A0ABY9R415_9BACT|nr:glycine zipper domain-containing protein [Nitratidesulfovibrio liaohensis]WMW65748.1 glycine zipper domain-containing protein [Nitratidesulfovibrio liaohensis]
MKRLIILALTAVLGLTGCASKNLPPKITDVNYYPQCYQTIGDLRDADRKAAQSAAVGAVVGAVGGAAIGYLTTGRPAGALIGALGGAAVGGTIGYAAQRQKDITDTRSRYASYVKDISSDIKQMDQLTLAAKAASSCYDQQFTSLAEQFKNKQISKEEYTLRYQEIRNGLTEAASLLGQVYTGAKEKEQQYQAALEDEAKKAGTAVPVATKPAAPAPVAAAPAPAVKQAAAAKPKTSTTSKKTNTASKTKTPAAPEQTAAENTIETETAKPTQNVIVADNSKTPDRNFIEGLDEGSLEAVSAGVVAHRNVAEEAQTQKVAIENRLLQMDAINSSMVSSS